MALKFNCPECAATLLAPDDMPGREMRCGVCQAVFTVPGPRRRPREDDDREEPPPHSERPLFESGSAYSDDSDPEPRPRPRARPRYDDDDRGDDYDRPRRRRRPRPPAPPGRSPLFWVVVIFSVLFLGGCGCCGGGYLLIPGEKWHRHQSAEGGFAVEMPVPAQKELPIPDMKLEPGQKVEGAIFWKRLECFAVLYTDLPPPGDRGATDEAILDEAIGGMRSEPGVKILRTEKISVSGSAGREAEFTADDGGNYVTRVVVSNKRLYVIIAGGRFVRPGNANVRRFINSFEVTDDGPPGGRKLNWR